MWTWPKKDWKGRCLLFDNTDMYNRSINRYYIIYIYTYGPPPEPPAKENHLPIVCQKESHLPIVCLKSSITIHIFWKTPSHNALICKTRLTMVLLNESASTEQNPEGRLFLQPFSTTDTSRPAPSLYRHGPPVPAGGGL